MLSSKGLTNFGEVTADSGLPAAPIKLSIGENTKDVDGKNHGYGLRYCPKKVCKLQSSYICVMNKKSTKNNEAYKRTKIGINF